MLTKYCAHHSEMYVKCNITNNPIQPNQESHGRPKMRTTRKVRPLHLAAETLALRADTRRPPFRSTPLPSRGSPATTAMVLGPPRRPSPGRPQVHCLSRCSLSLCKTSLFSKSTPFDQPPPTRGSKGPSLLAVALGQVESLESSGVDTQQSNMDIHLHCVF